MSSIGENKDSISMDQTDEEAFRFAMTIAVGSVLPMVLKSAVDLDLLELIKKAGPNGSSASELAAQLPTNNPDAATMIKRILRLLAAHSILICNTGMLPGGDGTEPRYFLPAMCKFLTKNAEGVSLAPICMMIQDKILMESWYHLKDAVLEGGIPFNRAYGMSAFEYPAIDPRFNKVFNTAMSEQSNIFMNKIIEVYKGFEGVESLVDVGGGIGTTLCMIKLKYPSIKCINFDLPHVVQEAPPYPGVEHKGGDMFVSVPKADAIFMKWICHDWSDAHCQKLLKNCYEALPKNGKVIIAECMFPEDSCESKNHKNIQRVAISDVIMLAYNPGGKERSENEFHALAKGAGFTKFEKVCSAFSMWIMELHK